MRVRLGFAASVAWGSVVVAHLTGCRGRDVDQALQAAQATCVGTEGDSRAIPFTKVDLGERAYTNVPYPKGPAGRRAVTSDAEWSAVWEELTDSLPRPTVNFRDSVVIIVASREYTTGPTALEIEDVRNCAGAQDIVVGIRLHASQQRYDSFSRSLRAIALARNAVQGRAVRFVDVPDAIDR